MLQGNYAPILSLETCVGMGCLKILDSDKPEHIYSMKFPNELTREHVLDQFQGVFSGLEKLEAPPHEIHLDASVLQVVHPRRRVPVAIHSALKEKLEEMVTGDVNTPVTEATDWVSSMVIVRKPCIDPKDLNRAINREPCPFPTIKELTTRIGNIKVFTVLDASNGFWQIPLEEKSSMLTCFNTPFGCFRMPFGLSSSPEVWQRRMHEKDCQGLKSSLMICLIIGRGETFEQAVSDHDQN